MPPTSLFLVLSRSFHPCYGPSSSPSALRYSPFRSPFRARDPRSLFLSRDDINKGSAPASAARGGGSNSAPVQQTPRRRCPRLHARPPQPGCSRSRRRGKSLVEVTRNLIRSASTILRCGTSASGEEGRARSFQMPDNRAVYCLWSCWERYAKVLRRGPYPYVDTPRNDPSRPARLSINRRDYSELACQVDGRIF